MTKKEILRVRSWDQKYGSQRAWERLSSSWGLAGGPAGSSRQQSREHSTINSKGHELSWSRPSGSRPLGAQRQKSFSTMRGLPAVFLALTFLTSCCSAPTLGPRPLLPVGRPAATSDALTKSHLEAWKPDPKGIYLIPKRELVNVLLNLGSWKAYALALEAAGDWK